MYRQLHTIPDIYRIEYIEDLCINENIYEYYIPFIYKSDDIILPFVSLHLREHSDRDNVNIFTIMTPDFYTFLSEVTLEEITSHYHIKIY